MTDLAVVLGRLERETYLRPVKSRMLDMRRVLAGDFSRLEDDAPTAAHPKVPEDERAADSSFLKGMRWLLNTSFESGLSNDLVLNVRTLMIQAGLKVPDVEFENAQPKEAVFMSSYLKQVWGERPRGCVANRHFRQTLLYYLSDGMGWTHVGQRPKGCPGVRSADSLDVIWEPTCPMLDDLQWLGMRRRGTYGEFAKEFGDEKFDQVRKRGRRTKSDDSWKDARTEIRLYWDAEEDDDEGSYFALWDAAKHGDVRNGEPVTLEKGPNPNYSEVDGWHQPYLPLEPMYFMLLPSTLAPTSIVEMMLPHEISARIFERSMQITAIRGVPTVFGPKLTAEQAEIIESGEPMAYFPLEEGQAPPERWDSVGVPREMFQIWQQQKQMLQQMSGVNPYATGGKLEGVDYAAEVNAIRETAGLMAASVAIDMACHVGRVARKTLMAARYDSLRRRINLDGVPVWFGSGTPNGDIYNYFETDADPVVSEDSLSYASKESRIAFYSRLLEVSLNPAVMAFAPKSSQQWYRKLVQETGTKDVAGHFEAPMAAAAPAEQEQLAQAAVG